MRVKIGAQATISAAALLSAALLMPGLSRADDASGTPFAPAAQDFSCVLPQGWTAFEDVGGGLVHLLGPQNPEGDYRTGMDIEFMREGSPGFVPYKQEVAYLRDGDKDDKVDSTTIQALRVSGVLGRYFESNEIRYVPDGALPSSQKTRHHFTAFIPVAKGQSYYLLDLTASEDTYLNYRGLFLNFLKSFRITPE